MVLLELDRGQVADARVRPDGVVVLAPGFDDDLRFASRIESLEAQALVAKPAVERFAGAVLPRLARIDDGCLDAGVGQPLKDRATYELGTAVRAQVGRRAVVAHQSRQDLDVALGADTAGDVDG